MTDRPTILLADDDPTITNALTPFLERAGFHVLTVVNGAEALQKTHLHRPDLIVLDVLMPRMVPTPFDMKDVLEFYDHNAALIWSPDGRYGLLGIHPEDDITRGGTSEEKEQLKGANPKDLEISASTLYLFDAEEDTWREIYRADRKFFYSVHWSADGQWIAFAIATSAVIVHPLRAEDGFYVVHPDGSGLQRLGGNGGYILGWVGNSLLIQRFTNPASGEFSYTIEMQPSKGRSHPCLNPPEGRTTLSRPMAARCWLQTARSWMSTIH